MSFMAAGIVTAGALGAGGSIWSGLIQADAAKGASAAQADASMRAENGLNMRLMQALGLTSGFRAIGENAGNTLGMLTVSPAERARQQALERSKLESNVNALKRYTTMEGQQELLNSFPILTGKNASERRGAQWTEYLNKGQTDYRAAQDALDAFDKQAKIESDFAAKGGTEASQSPLFQMGVRNLNRSLAAKGLTGSGAGIEAEARLNSMEGDAQFARLFQLFGVGANAATGAANQVQGFAGPIAQTQQAQGQAQAQGYLGAGQANAGMISGVANSVNGAMSTGLNYNMYDKLINRNTLKSNGDTAFDSEGYVGGTYGV